MTNETPNGIRIGDDNWIMWIDYDPAKEVSGNLLFAPLKDLWSHLETNCVADCCGLDAFDFSPENVQRATIKLADPSLSQKLSKLRSQLAASCDIAYDITRWNCSLQRDMLIQLVDHISRCVNAV